MLKCLSDTEQQVTTPKFMYLACVNDPFQHELFDTKHCPVRTSGILATTCPLLLHLLLNAAQNSVWYCGTKSGIMLHEDFITPFPIQVASLTQHERSFVKYSGPLQLAQFPPPLHVPMSTQSGLFPPQLHDAYLPPMLTSHFFENCPQLLYVPVRCHSELSLLLWNWNSFYPTKTSAAKDHCDWTRGTKTSSPPLHVPVVTPSSYFILCTTLLTHTAFIEARPSAAFLENPWISPAFPWISPASPWISPAIPCVLQ